MAIYEKNKYFNLFQFALSILILLYYIINYKSILWNYILRGYILFLPVLGYIMVVYFKNRKAKPKLNFKLFIFFIILSFIYGLGSAVPIFITTSNSSFFILIGLIILLADLSLPNNFPTRIIGLTSICLIAAIGIIFTSLANPYRQPQFIWSYNSKISLKIDGKPLILSSLTASYLENIHRIASELGFKPNTPIIDLSGQSLGTMYSLGGYTPMVPWILSGVYGSDKFFLHALNLIPCSQIAESWIIYDTTPILNNQFNPHLLIAVGAKFPDDYVQVGMLTKYHHYGNYSPDSTPQFIFKPNRHFNEAITECENNKRKLSFFTKKWWGVEIEKLQ
jgi:hypothetical protein